MKDSPLSPEAYRWWIMLLGMSTIAAPIVVVQIGKEEGMSWMLILLFAATLSAGCGAVAWHLVRSRDQWVDEDTRAPDGPNAVLRLFRNALALVGAGTLLFALLAWFGAV